jgi:hypothetical protein
MKHSSTKHDWRAVCGLLTMLLMSGVPLQAYASGTSLPRVQSALPPSPVVIEPTIEPTIEPALDAALKTAPVVTPSATPNTTRDELASTPFQLSTFRAVYKADYKGLPIRATGIRELSRTADNDYLLSSSANSFVASITEQSRFSLGDDNQIIPNEYQYHRKGIGKNRDATLRFDWAALQVENDVQARPWKMSIPLGALDKLSYQLQMRHDLAAAHHHDLPWPDLTYQVADGGKLKTYQFSVVGLELVTTPVGKFNALRVTRVRKDSDRITDFWLAPEYDFMLVRFIQKEEDRGGFELMLKEATFRDEIVKGL